MSMVNQPFLSATYALTILSLMTLVLTACGQKNDLYLVDRATQTVMTSPAALESSSNPQDVAFASLDGAEDQREGDTEQQPIFPAVSDDPNDY